MSNKFKTWITNPYPEDILVEVEYSLSPADPSVGIYTAGVEIDSIEVRQEDRVSIDVDLNHLDDNQLESLCEEILESLRSNEEAQDDNRRDQKINDKALYGGTI